MLASKSSPWSILPKPRNQIINTKKKKEEEEEEEEEELK